MVMHSIGQSCLPAEGLEVWVWVWQLLVSFQGWERRKGNCQKMVPIFQFFLSAMKLDGAASSGDDQDFQTGAVDFIFYLSLDPESNN